MKRIVMFCAALALSVFCTGNVMAQDVYQCEGSTHCIFDIDGSLSPACIEAIEILVGPLTGTGTVKIALVNFKTLDGICFEAGLGDGYHRITQTQEPSGFRFEYESQSILLTSNGDDYTSADPLHLRSVNTYPNELGDNPGPIVYEVTAPVRFNENLGPRVLTLHPGSSVEVTTIKPRIICDLTGDHCEIDINGGPIFSINPTITIESEPLQPQGGNIQVGYVLSKDLFDNGLSGLTMTLAPTAAPDESFFLVESINPGFDFPAMARGYFATQIQYNGDTWNPIGGQVLEVEATSPVNEWPPNAGTAQYILMQPIQYENNVGDVLTIHGGMISN